MLMQTFIVHGKNQSGELAKLTGALALKDVNVLITALGVNGQGVAPCSRPHDPPERRTGDGR